MRTLKCDICSGGLSMDPSGEFAICELCGMKHTKKKMKQKAQELIDPREKKKKRLKTALIISGIMLFIILCIPIKSRNDEGGRDYRAVLWYYTTYFYLDSGGGLLWDEAFAIFPFNLFW